MSYRKNFPHPETGDLQAGTVLEIVEAHEPIIRLTLEDGTLVRIKVAINEIARLDQFLPDGKPNFVVNANLNANFIPPEDQEA